MKYMAIISIFFLSGCCHIVNSEIDVTFVRFAADDIAGHHISEKHGLDTAGLGI